MLKTVVLLQNFSELPSLFRHYPEIGCSFVMPWSEDPELYRQVCPPLSLLPAAVLIRIGNIYLPCLFPWRPFWRDPTPQAGEGWVVLSDGRVVFQGNRKNLSSEQLAQMKIKPPRCSRCRIRESCSGIYPAYLQVHGDKELRPLT